MQGDVQEERLENFEPDSNGGTCHQTLGGEAIFERNAGRESEIGRHIAGGCVLIEKTGI